MLFHLHVLTNDGLGDFQKYPFIATAVCRCFHLHIGADYIIYFEGPETQYREVDYMKTGRMIDLDVARINTLVKSYIGNHPFELITYLGDSPHITLYAQTYPAGTTKSVTIFVGDEDEKAAHLREVIVGMMQEVMIMVNLPD